MPREGNRRLALSVDPNTGGGRNPGARDVDSLFIEVRVPASIFRDPDDLGVATTRTITSLAAAGTSALNTTVLIPATTLPGVYHVCAKADANNTVAESDETNNTQCSAVTLTIAP